MSLKAVDQVFSAAPEHWTPGVRIIAALIGDHVNGEGQCWPSLGTLAARSGLSTRWVRKIISQLELEGVLTRQARFGGVIENLRQTSNLYIWTWESGAVITPVSRPLHLL